MKARKVMRGRGDKRRFSKTARKVHVKNIMAKPMRGGFRL